MDALKKKIEEAVRREGIDLIGFAPKSRFDALPVEKNPFTIFPEGRDGHHARQAHLPRRAARRGGGD